MNSLIKLYLPKVRLIGGRTVVDELVDAFAGFGGPRITAGTSLVYTAWGMTRKAIATINTSKLTYSSHLRNVKNERIPFPKDPENAEPKTLL